MLGAFFFEAELVHGMRRLDLQNNKSTFRVTSSSDGDPHGGGGGKAAMPSDAELLYEYRDRAATLEMLERMPAHLMAPLTAAAQKLLFDWQHPSVCTGRKFLVSKGNEVFAGLGSHVHISTAHVGLALEEGAIFIWSRDVAMPYTDVLTCGEATQNIECFFDPPTNCTLQDAESAGAEVILVSHGDAGLKLTNPRQFYHVPHQFQELWVAAGFPVVVGENTGQQDAVKYWYRLQVAAYLSRFNSKALAIMRTMRANSTLMRHIRGSNAGVETQAEAQAEAEAAVVSSDSGSAIRTLPHGTISVHIRHGDKHKEMVLVPTMAYLEQAAALVKLHPIGLAPYRIFLSTEDPSAIDEISKAITEGPVARAKSFSLDWWQVPRDNSNGPDQLAMFALPKAQLTLIWWLQLLLALECDAWVGTRGSNWNRLIDELRCVWVAKCQNIYAEVGDIDRWENQAWRRG